MKMGDLVLVLDSTLLFEETSSNLYVRYVIRGEHCALFLKNKNNFESLGICEILYDGKILQAVFGQLRLIQEIS